jgi:hypothetical protein
MPPLSVTGQLYFIYVQMFVPHRRHMPPQSVNRDSFTSFYVDVLTSQETHASTVCYRDSFPSFICRRCSYLTGDTCLHSLLPGQLSFFFM